MAGRNIVTTNIVKSLEDLGAAAKARELGRVVRGFIDRWSADSFRWGGSVRDIMTPDVATCSAVDTLHRAAQIMWDRDCGAVPVVDDAQRPTGLLTDRDLCMAAYTQGLPLVAISVGTVVSGRVHSVTQGDSIDAAVAVMRAQRIRRVVVTDGSQKVVGIVALADVARYVATLAPSRRDAALMLADLLGALSERRPVPGSARHAAE
jgi:CBS domain-containing protein